MVFSLSWWNITSTHERVRSQNGGNSFEVETTVDVAGPALCPSLDRRCLLQSLQFHAIFSAVHKWVSTRKYKNRWSMHWKCSIFIWRLSNSTKALVDTTQRVILFLWVTIEGIFQWMSEILFLLFATHCSFITWDRLSGVKASTEDWTNARHRGVKEWKVKVKRTSHSKVER